MVQIAAGDCQARMSQRDPDEVHRVALPSHLGAKLAGEFEALKRTRDELRVQIRLAKADARDLWDRTECKFEEVERKLRLASRKTDAPLREVVRVLLREIRDGYHRIRQTL